MTFMTIGEVARRAGVRPSALRYYEEAGILPAVPRVNGRRRYDADMVRMIEVLRFAQQAGFRLEEVRTLFHGLDRGTPLSEAWRSLAQSKLAELDALVANARRMRHAIEVGLQCGCMRLEDCTLPEMHRSPAAKRRNRSGEGVR
jgi:MerR family redox-sensitive transcriptional activator SoxR